MLSHVNLVHENLMNRGFFTASNPYNGKGGGFVVVDSYGPDAGRAHKVFKA